jgi:isopenicillin N synthase-like dioxygenase
VARQIEAACREHGFFYVTGHGVAPDLLARLTEACVAFFALPQAAKMEIAMARGGPAWRGYFPFFFDPDFTAEIPPLPGRAAVSEGGHPRWDGQNLQAFTGTYGDYLLGKVSKVFPQLRRDVLTDEAP